MTQDNLVRAKKSGKRTRRELGASTHGSNGTANDLERRRALGQYFTPPDVAQFMWDMIALFRKRKLPKGARIIDPACGEGVFLSTAPRDGAALDLCGVDIDETLVSRWRTDTGLQDAQLHCANGLVDYPATRVASATFDVVVGNPPFAGAGVRNLLQLLEAKASKADAKQGDLFGPSAQSSATKDAEISSAERLGLDRLARQLSHYACWRLPEQPSDEMEVEQLDNSGLFAGIPTSSNGQSRAGEFDRTAEVIEHWPANRLLDVRRPDIRQAIQRMAATAIEVYFVERFVCLAKPGGLVAMIVPDSILASDQLARLRAWLFEHVQVLAVVSLPQNIFTGVGAKARTGIIFARRYSLAEQREIERLTGSGVAIRIPKRIVNKPVQMFHLNADHDNGVLQEYLSSALETTRREVNTPIKKGH